MNRGLMHRLVHRLLPAPLSSAVLALTWLLLNQSASVGHLLIAGALALVLPWVVQSFRPEVPRPRLGLVALRLTGVVMWDIVVSNITVARLVLGPPSRIRPGYAWVPLDLRDPHGIVALAAIITLTPGTLSAQLTDDRRHLLVHALDLPDEAGLVQQIKQRYEDPLRRMFE